MFGMLRDAYVYFSQPCFTPEAQRQMDYSVPTTEHAGTSWNGSCSAFGHGDAETAFPLTRRRGVPIDLRAVRTEVPAVRPEGCRTERIALACPRGGSAPSEAAGRTSSSPARRRALFFDPDASTTPALLPLVTLGPARQPEPCCCPASQPSRSRDRLGWRPCGRGGCWASSCAAISASWALQPQRLQTPFHRSTHLLPGGRLVLRPAERVVPDRLRQLTPSRAPPASRLRSGAASCDRHHQPRRPLRPDRRLGGCSRIFQPSPSPSPHRTRWWSQYFPVHSHDPNFFARIKRSLET